ncbi:MAG: hypothetical protein JST54_21485 [Deltaproteobacteria bacterium]|nr:hypothetical protein [Deltaproteobacteria bacterium]
MVPSGDIKARLLAAVHAEPAPTRAARRRMAGSIVALVAVALAIQFFGVLFFLDKNGLRPQPLALDFVVAHSLGDRPVAFVVLTTLAWGLAIAALLWGMRSRDTLGPPSVVLWAVAMGSLVFPFVVGLIGNAIWPTTAVAKPHHPGFFCLHLSLALSTVPLTAWVFVRRESDPVHPVALGATVGALGAAIAGLLVNLDCPFSDPAHILVGHIAPGFAQIAVGALMGKLVIAMRSQGAPLPIVPVLGGATGAWLASLYNVGLQRSCERSDGFEPSTVIWLPVGLALGVLIGLGVAALRPKDRAA